MKCKICYKPIVYLDFYIKQYVTWWLGSMVTIVNNTVLYIWKLLRVKKGPHHKKKQIL